MLQARECTPTLYPSVVFTLGLIVESIKKFGGALRRVKKGKKMGKNVFCKLESLFLFFLFFHYSFSFSLQR
jgi:hypothetical protein